MQYAREFRVIRSVVASIALIVVLLACNGTDLGSGSASGQLTTVISGKVTLPTALSSKPGYKAEMVAKMPRGKPGSLDYKPASKPVAGDARSTQPAQSATLIEAPVELYDASHPEWIYPIAVAQTDSTGAYSLELLTNAAENGSNYLNGAPIPAGYYTLLSKKTDPVTNELQVAIQTVVKSFAGAITGTNLVAQPSDAMPKILSIQGVKKNTDGTDTWGSKSTASTTGSPLAATNSAVQIVFSMAMYRQSVLDGGIAVECVDGIVDGKWTITADWTTATFYPTNPLPSGDCTVVVKGSDTSTTPVKNVYENPRAKTGYGYFTVTNGVDSVKPTGVILSPDATNASVISPIRFASNELLDINTITVFSDPSFGDRPRVVFLGKADNSSSQYKYLYEVIPSRALKLDTDYDLILTGAKDLAGNDMSVLNYSFGTADSAPGVTSSETFVQEVQLEALTTFGKWIRALNEHNIGTMQSLMSGDFVYEYDTIAQGNNESDINRDGRLTINEFSLMLEKAFMEWEYCKTSTTGTIVDQINVDLVNGKADFAFTLSGSSELTSQECRSTVPKDKLYLTLKQQNSAWVIVRASEGIDTREKPLVVYDYIPLLAPASDSILATTPTIASPLNFSWDDSIAMVDNQTAKAVTSYVFIIWNSRNEWNGRAYVIDPSVFKTLDGLNSIYQFSYPFDLASLPAGVKDISAKFGFDTFSWDYWSPDNSYWTEMLAAPGEEMEWSVLGLGSKKVSDDFSTISSSDLLRDIVASSKTAEYQNPGTRPEISVEVLANGVPVKFSEFIWGYDVGASGKVTLKLNSTNANPSWQVQVSGKSGYDNYSGSDAVEIQLYQGQNWIWLTDGKGLYHWFTIATTGGVPPKLSIYTVMTDNGFYLSPDAWDYVSALGTTKVTIIGNVSDGSSYIHLNLYNWRLGASEYRLVNVDPVSGFFTTDVYYQNPDDPATSPVLNEKMKIYKGDNWISLSSQNGNYNSLGIYTDTGSAYIPPITVSIPEALLTEDNGNSTEWDASADNDNRVLVTGKMSNYAKAGFNATYSLYSDAGYVSGNLYVDPFNDGKYSLPIDLYHGWNYLYIYDSVNGWAYADIYTDKGKVVVPLQIRTVDGVAPPYQGAAMSVSSCNAVINGIAEPGSALNVYWYGYNGSSYNENIPLYVSSIPTVDTNGDGVQDAAEFSLTVPVLSNNGSGAYNYLDIYNSMWRWTGVSLSTSATGCVYTAPVNTVSSITGLSSADVLVPASSLSPLTFSNYDLKRLFVNGTHSRAGHTVTSRLTDQCGVPHVQSTAATGGVWSFANIPLYNGYNSLSISDGYSSKYYSVNSTAVTNIAQPSVTLALTAPGGLSPSSSGCSYSYWDVGTATTITIQATLLDSLSGTGTLYSNQKTVPLNFVAGVATATVNVYQGDNYFYLYDPAGRYTSTSVTSSNGIAPPKAISITSHAQGDTIPAGSVTISGGWDTSWYTPDYLYASVYECNANWSCTYQSFSNDGWYTAFDSIGTNSYSFTTTIHDTVNGLPTAYTEIYVYGSSSVSAEGHAHVIYVNNNPNGYTEWWYKPSAGGAPVPMGEQPEAKLVEQDRIERMLNSQKAAQVKALAKPRH